MQSYRPIISTENRTFSPIPWHVFSSYISEYPINFIDFVFVPTPLSFAVQIIFLNFFSYTGPAYVRRNVNDATSSVNFVAPTRPVVTVGRFCTDNINVYIHTHKHINTCLCTYTGGLFIHLFSNKTFVIHAFCAGDRAYIWYRWIREISKTKHTKRESFMWTDDVQLTKLVGPPR